MNQSGLQGVAVLLTEVAGFFFEPEAVCCSKKCGRAMKRIHLKWSVLRCQKLFHEPKRLAGSGSSPDRGGGLLFRTRGGVLQQKMRKGYETNSFKMERAALSEAVS